MTMNDLRSLIARRQFIGGAAAASIAATSVAQDRSASSILISNVRIFDGHGSALMAGHVLVTGTLISRVSASPIVPPTGTTMIDGRGRVLMPGLTDAHWHMMLAANPMVNLEQVDQGLMFANTVAEAKRTLLRGFTTVRDVGGPVFGIKAAIDRGVIPGPRVYPSGAIISQSAGHGDFREGYSRPTVLGGQPSHLEEIGLSLVADGVPQVQAAVRAQLRRGASQIKLTLGGGVISEFDPLDSIQYSPAEIEAAVGAARDWGTYVCAHVYASRGIRRALAAGVSCIEHGHLADDATLALMAEKGVWLSTQPLEPGDNPLPPELMAKIRDIPKGRSWRDVMVAAKRHGVKTAFGTDLLFQPDGITRENLMLSRLSDVYTSLEALRIVTSGNAELFAMSGPRDPYRHGKLGVIAPGAWADMLLIDGDPLVDFGLLCDPDRTMLLIVKNGEIHKNLLLPA